MENRYETFTILINSINRNIRRIKNDTMKDYNLKSHHVSCLYYLYKENTLTATELSEICYEDKAAISRSLDYLEKNGYIVCNSQTKKRYKSTLLLTEKGLELGEYISNKIDAVLEQTSMGLSEEQLNIFYDALKLIADNMSKI